MGINLGFTILLMILFADRETADGEWIISDKSRLYIRGNTNINSFECSLKNYDSSDTLDYVEGRSEIKLVARNTMTVPLHLFDCGSRQMTKDMRSALKERKHPNLEIRFHTFSGSAIRDNSYVMGIADIFLAGSNSRYTIRYHALRKGNVIKLTGTQSVNFADFNLTPPQKLNGMIRVDECLDVRFELELTERDRL